MSNSVKVASFRLSGFSLWFGSFTASWCLFAGTMNLLAENQKLGITNLMLSVLNGFFVFIHIQRRYFSSEPVSILMRNKEYQKHVQMSDSNFVTVSYDQFKSSVKNLLKDHDILKIYIEGSCLFTTKNNEVLLKIENHESIVTIFMNQTYYVLKNRKHYENAIYFVDTYIKDVCDA